MRGPPQANSLNGKFLADQVVQVDAGNDYIPAQVTRRFVRQAKSDDKFLENLDGKEGDLPLVIIAVVVKSIAANSVTGDAFHLLGFDQGKIVRGAPMMAEVIVARGNEDLPNDHRRNLADAEPDFANDFAAEALL